MNKDVLISIQPKWCELISNGKKTIEVRKTEPKLQTPFKCYIYCTGGTGKEVIKDIVHRWNGTRLIKRHVYKGWLKDRPEQTWQILLDYGFTHPIHNGDYELNGKVIGEFVCDKVEKFTVGSLRCDDIEKLACLSYSEMINYFYKPNELDGNTVKFGYGWHISDLKIYDTPKELIEFKKAGYMTEEQWLYALYPNTHCHYAAWAKRFDITRPPQSWQFVKPLEEKNNL